MRQVLLFFVAMLALDAAGQTPADSIDKQATVGEVTVTSSAGLRRMGGAVNGVTIGRQELFKAACCNLGESFTTNPSVDVSYSDAATGAKQIRLLGLSGTYVQMLTEQLPAFRGAALPYSLDYVPGPWMQSIQVSKGAATVKNGHESMTGQIDIEYKKPNDAEQLNANLYADSKSRFEANADANLHLNEQLSTILLVHGEKGFGHHDDNDDGFLDMPRRQQFNLQNRWKLVTTRYIMHAGLSLLKDEREGGQRSSSYVAMPSQPTEAPSLQPTPLYTIDTEADRYEAYMKHAFILRPERQENIALMANGSLHLQDAQYGHQQYDNNEKTLSAQLMYETNLGDAHQLSLGTSFNHYHSRQHLDGTRFHEKETTGGAYAQYTLTLEQLTLMVGLRADHSSCFHWFVTPRLHLKYSPSDLVSFRLSAGKGYRTPRFYAENHFLLASSRPLRMQYIPTQEKAWNYGLNTAWNIPLAGQTLRLNAEYYYTDFQSQLVADYYQNAIDVYNTDKGYSHTIQIDATYPFAEGLTATAAWRWNDVKSRYHGQMLERPLTSRYKALLSLSYAPGLALWHFDTTLQLNGGGRIVDTERFSGYEQLQAQVTRDFRHLSVYVGGENLTNHRQKHPIRGYDNPWGQNFDATLVWAPVHGPIFYLGIRYNFERI